MHEAIEDLRFVSSEGGPLIALPTRSLRNWWGTFDSKRKPAESGTDYERACGVSGHDFGILTLRDQNEALVCLTCDSTTFYAHDSGGFFIQWVAGETTRGVVHAVLHARVEWTELASGWVIQTPELALFDSAADGRDGIESITPPALPFSLPIGTYDLAELYWEGEVRSGDRVEEVMVRALRVSRHA